MTKEYLRIADVFSDTSQEHIEQLLYSGVMSKDSCELIAHAVFSHDELVAENERLRTALTSSRLSLSNAAMNMKWFDIPKAQEILREINSIDRLIS